MIQIILLHLVFSPFVQGSKNTPRALGSYFITFHRRVRPWPDWALHFVLFFFLQHIGPLFGGETNLQMLELNQPSELPAYPGSN